MWRKQARIVEGMGLEVGLAGEAGEDEKDGNVDFDIKPEGDISAISTNNRHTLVVRQSKHLPSEDH